MEAKHNDQKQNEKEKDRSSIRWEQRKPEKDSVPQDKDRTKKKKSSLILIQKWPRYSSFW